MRTFEEIKNAVKAKGYKFFETGNYNLNFIWERTNMDVTNHFTDFLHVLYYVNGDEQILTIPATTKPGWKGSLESPVTVEGVTGTAVIKPGQYSGAWQFIDSYIDFSKYPYFRQIQPISYWRDGDKDMQIDETQDQEHKIFGTHWHRMSYENNIKPINEMIINNWSLGCMGSPVKEFIKVVELTRKSLKVYPKGVFTGTLIESEDIS